MKLFNKFVSIVTVVAFVLSMMAVPAFAAGLADYLENADGNEKLVVTYYKDSTLNEVITSAEPGATVYAKVSANLPTATLGSLDVDLKATGATFEAETDADMFVGTLPDTFERPTPEGVNIIKDEKSVANIYIFIKNGSSHDSPTNDGDWLEQKDYTNIGVTSFDIATYELKVTGEAGSKVSFANNGGEGLQIGVFDWGKEAMGKTPFTVEGTLAIESAASEPVITYTYDATIASTKIDPELDDAAYEAAVKALVTVTKTTKTDDEVTGTETVAAKAMVVDKAAKTVTVTFADDTTKVLNYTEMEITYGTPKVTMESSFAYETYAENKDAIAEEIAVTIPKTKGDDTTDISLTEGTDYDVEITLDENANSGKAIITYKGLAAGNTTDTKEFTLSDPTVVYTNIQANLTENEFPYGSVITDVEAKVVVTADKAVGRIPAVSVALTLDEHYSLDGAINDNAGYIAVTLIIDGTIDGESSFDFTITDETFTYSDYKVVSTLATAYPYTVDADTLVGLVKVTATKTSEQTGNATENHELTGEYTVTVNKDENKVVIAWVDGSAHAGAYTFQDIPVTFNDVIEYKNVSATMSKTSFAEGTSEDDILAFLTVSVEKWVNGEKEDGFTADYNVTVDRVNNKVVVDFADDAIEDKEINGITFYSSDAVVLKVVGGEGVTAGEVEEDDGEFKAIVKVEGLDTRVLYDAVLSISASAGVLEEVAVVTGSGYNVLPDAAIAGNVWTGTIYKGIDAVDLANGLLVVKVNTDGLADGTVIEVKVDSATLRMVDDTNLVDPFVEIPNTTEVLEVEVNAFVRNVEDVTLNDVEIDIVTLGPVTDAKFVDGVSLVDANDVEIDLTDKVTLNGTNRSIVIDDVALAVSATENVVKYTLKVEVAGYTTIESEIVVSYNGVDTNDWTVTNTLADAKIYAADVTGDDNTIAADDYSDVVAMYNQTAAFDIYEGNGININDISTTVYMYDNYGMKLVNKATGVIANN